MLPSELPNSPSPFKNVSSHNTLQKALRINLDEKKYGTIVEIGAGQEVARQFFLAGAAAGTIAKTMSAYDMTFSDAIYGVQEEKRYVSKGRLTAMLEHEFPLVVSRVGHIRPINSRFFAYGATVSAKSFNRENECHAWCGIRVQMFPGAEPSDIIVHVRMHDKTAAEQQDMLGTFGVNLIYGAYFYADTPKKLIDSLTDNIETDRLEIDMIAFHGPYFEDVDNRGINLHLIRSWKTRAVMMNADGQAAVPAELLHKHSIMAVRGSFSPVTKLNVDMIERGLDAFCQLPSVNRENTVVLAEITLNDFRGQDFGISEREIIERVSLLNALGYNVLISDYVRYFSLREYFRQYTTEPIGIALGVENICQIFNDDFYRGVEGGILEGFGKLFPDNTKLFVYPERDVTGEVVDFQHITVPKHLRYLYQHLLENHFIEGIECSNADFFAIHSREIIKAIKERRDGWQDKVPELVAEKIVSEQLLGYK